MTKGTDTLYFTYDAFGAPWTVRWNGTVYTYVTNLQGDVIAIVNYNNRVVVEYTYDAWGNILGITGTMATTLGTLNPLTYRGYVYDYETGLYYVSSRYYDPVWGRFLNSDVLVSTGQGMLGNNMFACCRNNPVNRKDASGTEDVSATDFNEDNNPLNDIGSPSGSGGSGSGRSGNGGPGGHSGSGGHSGPSGNGGTNGNGGMGSADGSSKGATSSASQGGKISSNSVAMDPSDALDTAIDYLGPGYAEAYPPGSGRFISADGLRQVRIGYGDLVGAHAGAPHMNFDLIGHGGSFHIYLVIR